MTGRPLPLSVHDLDVSVALLRECLLHITHPAVVAIVRRRIAVLLFLRPELIRAEEMALLETCWALTGPDATPETPDGPDLDHGPRTGEETA